MSNHSPRPWAWTEYAWHPGFMSCLSSPVGTVLEPREDIRSETDKFLHIEVSKGDAMIIEAAADLLAACEATIVEWEELGDPAVDEPRYVRIARAAIAKAKGES